MRLSVLKIHWIACSRSCDHKKKLSFELEEKKMFHILGFLKKTKLFRKGLFYHEMVGLTNFGLDIGVCIVNLKISINKYL